MAKRAATVASAARRVSAVQVAGLLRVALTVLAGMAAMQVPAGMAAMALPAQTVARLVLLATQAA
jgi:hypothetical protein